LNLNFGIRVKIDKLLELDIYIFISFFTRFAGIVSIVIDWILEDIMKQTTSYEASPIPEEQLL
jgi:hypothetical protein